MNFEILGADLLLGYYVCWPRYSPPELVFAEFKAIESQNFSRVSFLSNLAVQ